MIYFVSLKFSIQILQTLSYKRLPLQPIEIAFYYILFLKYMFYFSAGILLRLYLYIFNHHCMTISGEFKSNAANQPSSFPSASFDTFNSAVPVFSKSHTINFSNFPVPSGSLITFVIAVLIYPDFL